MRILNVDSSILNSIQQCAKKTQYNFIYNLQPHERDEALEKGDLMHKMLEVYYSMLLDAGADRNSPLWMELINEAGLHPEGFPITKGIEAGLYFASKMSIPSAVSEEVIDQFKAYCEYYAHDEWHPIAVEEVGSRVLYEEPDLKVVYSFKIDMVAEKGRIIAPFDHKTGSRRQEPSSLSNQFIGYCYALGTDRIIVNKIGFQKTLKPAERFQRYILTIDKDRITEWIKNSVYWIMQYAQFQEQDYYPMNLTSCDKYSGCVFKRVCESDPDNRAWKLERDFVTVDKWDVAKTLESGATIKHYAE